MPTKRCTYLHDGDVFVGVGNQTLRLLGHVREDVDVLHVDAVGGERRLADGDASWSGEVYLELEVDAGDEIEIATLDRSGSAIVFAIALGVTRFVGCGPLAHR